MRVLICLFLVCFSKFSFSQKKNEIKLNRHSKVAIIVDVANEGGILMSSVYLLKDVLENTLEIEVSIQKELSNQFDSYFVILNNQKHKIELGRFDEECFSIEQKENNKIVFEGFDENAISNGIVTFTEKILGFNYFYPHQDFKSYKKVRKLVMDNINIKDCPSFLQRQLSPIKTLSKGTNGDFALANKLNEKIDFHHNFSKQINKQIYKDSNIDFFPILKGERYIPTNESDFNWQVNFNSSVLIDTFVKIIIRNHIKTGSKTFSLGINDSENFDQSAQSKDYLLKKTNFLKKNSFSNDYYSFVNAVAEKVEKSNIDIKFGLLAYINVIEPPAFSLNKNVVPFITSDRMRWGDSALKLQDQNLCNSWLKVANQIGLYDYTYGSFFLIPRLYSKTIKNYLEWNKEMGVKYYYSELYYNFTEGSKVWLLSKLLWNPDYDIDSLNHLWNVNAFGQKSTKFMKKYFDNWENYWDSDIKKSNWYTNITQYLPFNNLEYLTFVDTNLFLNNIDLLNKALNKAKNEFQKRNISYYIQFNQIQFELVKFIHKQNSNNKAIKQFKTNDEFQELLRRYFKIFDNEKTFLIMKNLIER